jgi:multidrug efflux pump subunit AcrA (membrane-fusion protein)
MDGHNGDGMTVALLPASTGAFEVANIMARISGYVAKRYVDIGDHVKADQLLAEISAPELDHQIAQAQATLAVSEAALNQAKAKRRSRASPGTATAIWQARAGSRVSRQTQNG